MCMVEDGNDAWSLGFDTLTDVPYLYVATPDGCM